MVMETVSLVGSPAQPGSGGRPADLEDGLAEEVLTRRRSGTLPMFGAANSLKPGNIIFAPPNNLARYSVPQQPRRSVTIPFVGEITSEVTKKWLCDPYNWPIIAWGLAVFVSGAVLFMVMVGMLNRSLPRKATRDLYFEASNQTINALFTLFVLLLHPVRVLHLVWLLRWRPKDAVKLRSVYCKGGLPKPNEWMHLLIVLLLYQINCFAQYASCALNWAYTRSNRPVIPVVLCFVMALCAGCAAGVYTSVSPLGKGEGDEDEGRDAATLPGPRFLHTPPKYDRLLDRATTPSTSRPRADHHVLVENPQWQGGLLSCWEAPALVAATLCCFPCVLGHNLSRLGFGNRYVHVFTFTLACLAPFFIFECGSINVPSREYRHFMRAIGIIVSICGLCYGGYWRIQMRETYNLPGETFCCDSPNMSDFMRWLFCSACSLCQEVRTAEAFDISNNKFYVKVASTRLRSPLEPPVIQGPLHL